MAYNAIDPDSLIPGAKIIASLATKTRDNPLAVAAGDISVPIAKVVDLGKALRTAETGAANVVKAAAGAISWGAAPAIVVERRSTPGLSTWVVPAGVTQIEVQAWGGGSGGYEGAIFPSFQYPHTGPCGAHSRGVMMVTPGETLTYQVGAGGAGGQSGGDPTAGGPSLLRNAGSTSHVTAGGGGTSPGVASAAGLFGVALLLDGRYGFGGATSGFRAIAPLSHNAYGSGGGTGQAGGQGYLQWRYVQP